MKDIKENIRSMLDQVAAQDAAAAQSFQDIITAKIAGALEDMKVELGQSVFKSDEIQEGTGQIDESIVADDYHVSSEKSKFGGHRAKITHKEKGTIMYLSQHAYKDPKDAEAHGNTYLSSYEQYGDRSASKSAAAFVSKNKDKLAEESEQLDELSGATLGSYVQKARADGESKRLHARELDPSYPESADIGVEKAIQMLQYGKMSEGSEE